MSVLTAVRNLSPRHRRITRLENLATFCTTTAEVLDGGVLELPRALRITSFAFGANPFRAHVQTLIALIDSGSNLHDALTFNADAFPPMLRQMVAVGERTETLPAMLSRAGEFYTTEARAVRDRIEHRCASCGR